jgi:asparagine synthase (glutamine-hydrolysing)
MCGIAGFIGKESFAKRDVIQKMLVAINHRGPDSSSITEIDDVIIGFNRLSINDLSNNGMQPFETEHCSVFSNGEIYNHKELKRKYDLYPKLKGSSDIEIIPHLYERLGFEFLNELNGGFAIVIYDKMSKSIHLILDRFGKKPLYYYQVSDGFYFASELKAFLVAFDDLTLDKKLINWAFYQGYFPYPDTPVNGIKKIGPSEIFSIDKNLLFSSKNWYKMQPSYTQQSLELPELESNFLNLIDDAVDIRMHADVSAGLYLSGGLDSTTVAMSCSRLGYKNIHTFTGHIQGKDYSTDNLNATRFAKENQFIHHSINIDVNTYRNNIFETSTAFDEINFESANINFIELIREAKKHVTIMLDGVGGDEIFLGYNHQQSLHRLPISLRNSIPKFKFIEDLLSKNSRKYFSIYAALSDVKLFSFQSQSFIPINIARKMKYFNLDDGLFNLETQISKLDHGFKNTKELNYLAYLDILGLDMLNYQEVDRCSMFHSIEPRSPLSDYRIWELIYSINESEKYKGGRKGLMKSILSKRLPEYILSAQKDGFSNPFYIWFKDDISFRNDVLKVIDKRKELLNEVLGEEYVSLILSKWKLNGTVNWMDGVRLHQLLVFVIWHFVYFENKSFYKSNLSLSDFSSLL